MEIHQKNSKRNSVFRKTSKKKFEKENFQPGDVFPVKITALGSKNIGVAELKNGTTLLVPNTKCGEKVQVKIEKVFFGKHSDQNKKVKYAIATVCHDSPAANETNASQMKKSKKDKFSTSVQYNLKVGQKYKVTIEKKGPKNSGFVPISNNFLILVPNAKIGEKLVVEIQKMKQNYAIAKAIHGTDFNSNSSHVLKGDTFVAEKPIHFEQFGSSSLICSRNDKNGNQQPSSIDMTGFMHISHVQVQVPKMGTVLEDGGEEMIGQEFQINIPSSAKTFGNFFVLKFQGQILFVKKGLGVQFGDRVQIQIQKATENFAIAKIQKISPLSVEEKKDQVKQTLQKMIQSSMHFGEKAIHCNANMRKFLWYRKKGFPPTHRSARIVFQQNLQRPMMKRGRHILNVFKTQRCLNQALKQFAKYAAKGKTFLFVGTKKPASSLIAKTALLSQTSFFVNTRWLGGMLTNWKTILKSIAQIRPILKQKQKIQKKIFEKRQKIQRHLFQKVSLLRKKSQKFLIKGKGLIAQILNSQNFRIERSKKFVQRKNTLFAANLSLVQASKNLKIKKLETLQKIQNFENIAMKVLEQKQQLQTVLSKNIQKFKELETFFEIGQEFLKMKNSFEKKKKTKFIAVSSEKFETFKDSSTNWQVPNPSSEIFKKMIFILANFKKGTSRTNLVSLAPQGQQMVHSTSEMMVPTKSRKKSNFSKSVETSEKSSQNVILFSKFLKKFVEFLPFLQNFLKQLKNESLHQQQILQKFDSTLNKILHTQMVFKKIYEKTILQYSFVCSKLALQRKNLKTFQLNFKQFAAEQRLLKFLPKLRYFPTSQAKMYETLEFFMKKFVDPKLIYPMEQIYDQKLKFTSKKIATTRKQKWQRLEKYFGGITKMAKMNAKQISKNVAIIVGQQEEMSAVHECRKLGMKIFAIVDTNCDPKLVDHIIPANDDSRNSIHYILGEILTYICLGQKLRRKVSFRAKIQQMTKQKRHYEA